VFRFRFLSRPAFEMPFLPHNRHQSVTSTMIATCMLFGIDGAMISLALPSIRNDFAIGNESLSWAVANHLIGFMAVSPCVRWLCSHFGRREILLLLPRGDDGCDRALRVSDFDSGAHTPESFSGSRIGGGIPVDIGNSAR
jgi:hypothetical protein